MTNTTTTIKSLSRLKSVVRAYDIRGIVPNDLDEKDAFALGLVLGNYLKENHHDAEVLIGMDNRKSSFSISTALGYGFAESNCTVSHLGLVPTPSLYYNSFLNNYDKKTLGVMVTASHNPPDYNGFKVVFDSKILNGKVLNKAIEDYEKKLITGYDSRDLKPDSYLQYLFDRVGLNDIKTNGSKKILWDCNNGVTAKTIQEIAKNLPLDSEVINIGDEIYEQPDPTKKENLDRVLKIVSGYDLAFCFDGDGDRLLVITKQGKVLRGDRILLILAKHAAKRGVTGKVVVDIKTSSLITKELEKAGFETIVQKTGHSFIKSAMLDHKAFLGGEVSGHLFFPLSNSGNYIPYDDAILAALFLLKIFLCEEDFFNKTLQAIPQTFCQYDLKISCPKSMQKKIISCIASLLREKNCPFIDVDGVKYEDEKGWYLVRSSNTENALLVCVEGFNEKDYLEKYNYLMTILQSFNLNLRNVVKLQT